MNILTKRRSWHCPPESQVTLHGQTKTSCEIRSELGKNIQLKMTQCSSGRDLLQMCFQSKERFVIVGTVISAIMKQGAQYEMQRDY